MSDLPNVLLVMSDQQKANVSALLGPGPVDTPALARLAARGALYASAHTPHPLCAPARASLWTGRYSSNHGVRTNGDRLRQGDAHAFEVWRRAGYQTGLIGKNHCFAEPVANDFDVWCEIDHHGLPARGPKGMEWVESVETIERAHAVRRRMPRQAPSVSYAVTDFPLEHYSSALVARQTVEYLSQRDAQPFALWVSFPDPHPPYEVPRTYAEMFPPEAIELPPWDAGEVARGPERLAVLHRMLGLDGAPEADVRGVIGSYLGMTRFVDDGLGWILDALEANGMWEDTIVVFCSDHGDFAGEHRMMGKGGMFYDCLTRVPLAISCPWRVPSGVRVEAPVSLVDVLPTILDLQDLPGPAVDGECLPFEEPSGDRAVYAEYGAGGPRFTLADLAELDQPYGHRALYETLAVREAEGERKMVRTREWKYVHDPMGDRDELYDLRNDPWELRNLASEAGQGDRVAAMRRRLS